MSQYLLPAVRLTNLTQEKRKNAAAVAHAGRVRLPNPRASMAVTLSSATSGPP